MSVKLLSIFLSFFLVPFSNASDEGRFEGMLKTLIAKSVEVAGGKVSFTMKEKGIRFLFKKGDDEPSVLNYSEKREFVLKNAKISFTTKNYSVEIQAVEGKENLFVLREIQDVRSFGGELKALVVTFELRDREMVEVSQKFENEEEIRERLEREKK